MQINYKKLITSKNYEKIGEKRYYELKKEGIEQHNDIMFKQPSIKGYLLVKRAQEIVVSYKNKDLKKDEKLVLASNIIYPNNEMFSTYLLDSFTLYDLKNISSILSKYKQLNSLYEKMGYSANLDYNIIEPLIEKAKKIYGYIDNELFLNKVNGLVTFEPNQFILKK